MSRNNPAAPARIFEVVECDAPGAAGEQVAAICNGLDPAKFDVSLVYAARGESPEEYRAKCRGAKAAYSMPELTLRKLHRLFAEHRPDVVHAHSSKAGVLARAAAKAAGIKTIFYSPHGYGFLMQDRSAAARVGATIAASPNESAQAELLGAKRVHVVRDAYLGEFPEPLPHDDLVVGSSGHMTRARNPDAWVLLVQRLTDSRNGVQCAWIGGGEEEARTRTNLTNMNLLMKASVTGPLTVEETLQKSRGLDIFVRYSRADAAPNALLRAMALGLPVVASDIPAHRDVVVPGETGFLVDTEVQLLERCQELIDDADLRRRLGAGGRERVRREFSRERQLAELSRLYSA